MFRIVREVSDDRRDLAGSLKVCRNQHDAGQRRTHDRQFAELYYFALEGEVALAIEHGQYELKGVALNVASHHGQLCSRRERGFLAFDHAAFQVSLCDRIAG
ncbi:hypothetical protein D3C81_1525160 [compost metagenome]